MERETKESRALAFLRALDSVVFFFISWGEEVGVWREGILLAHSTIFW